MGRLGGLIRRVVAVAGNVDTGLANGTGMGPAGGVVVTQMRVVRIVSGSGFDHGSHRWHGSKRRQTRFGFVRCLYGP